MKRNPFRTDSLVQSSVIFSAILAGCSATRTEPRQQDVEPIVVSVVKEEAEVAHDPTRRMAPTKQLSELLLEPDVLGPAPSLVQHTFTEEGADFDPCISPDGKWLVFASTRHSMSPNLYYKAVDGAAVTQLTADGAAEVQPAISPDGQRVAFATNRSGNWDLWIVGLNGEAPTQVTSGAEDEMHPSWSPDGKKLVYCSLPPRGPWELWVTDADMEGNRRLIGQGMLPEWSPRGDTILFQRARQRGSRWFSVWTLELVNGEPRHPTEIATSATSALITPTWSPDGLRVAYAAVSPQASSTDMDASPGGKAQIWMVDADGRHRAPLTSGRTASFGPAWSPAGRVFFIQAEADRETIWSASATAPDGAAVEVTTIQPDTAPQDTAGLHPG